LLFLNLNFISLNIGQLKLCDRIKYFEKFGIREQFKRFWGMIPSRFEIERNAVHINQNSSIYDLRIKGDYNAKLIGFILLISRVA